MRTRFVVPLIFSILIAVCGFAGKRPNPTYQAVPLVVTVHPVDSDSNSCRICDDGLGQYIDGVDGVAASIDQNGNLIINFDTAQTPFRKLIFDYSDPVQPSNTFGEEVPASMNSYLSTVPGPDNVPIQNMSVNVEQCVQLGITFTDNDKKQTQYRNSFHRNFTNIDSSQTSYGVVTRISDTTWELEPKAAGCNPGIPTVGELITTPTVGHSDFVDRGAFYLPFKMTLEAK
jgi:hypothetical protein